MADVFLSYKREDQQIARKVAADLETEGYSVFFDVRIDVGDSWDATIERELNAAKAVVVLWSPKSRESKWVRREAREAMERRILCPAVIARCKVPLEFSDVQAADLIGRRAGDRAHVEWRRLCDGVRRCVGRKARGIEAPPVTPAAPAPRAAPKLSIAAPKLPRLPPLARAKASTASTATEAPSSSRRALVIGAAAIGGATAIGGGYYGWTRVRAEGVQRAWDDARAAGTRRAVRAFLREHPNAPQATEARRLLSRLPLRLREATTFGETEDEFNGASLNAAGTQLVTFGNTSRPTIWNLSTHDAASVLNGHSAQVLTAAFDLSGQKVLTASADGTARVWNVGDGSETARTIQPHWVNAAAFAPSGEKAVLTVTYTRAAIVWNIAQNREERRFSMPDGSGDINFPQFVRDGTQVLAACDDHTVRIWEVSSGATVQIFRGHTRAVSRARLSASEDLVASVSHDDTVRVWRLDGQGVATIRGHESPIWDANFDPSGTRLVTCSYDGTARVWDISSGRLISTLRHGGSVGSAIFDETGTRVVTASSDQTARIWDVESGTELASATHEFGVSTALLRGSQLVTIARAGQIWEIDEEA